MNFNKDYPIAILDTNIAITFPNILNILKGCNIVIPYTLIDEIDKVIIDKVIIEEVFCDNNKWKYYNARDFVNNFLALSEKANLSKDGYKLENDCMLYLDIDKNNSYHKDINLDSKNQDIKFIAEAKNLKEKYNDMEVVLISSDKIMKITASIFDVKVKNLEEFIMEYFKLDINELYELAEKHYYYGGYRKILEILLENKDIDIDELYKFAENSNLSHSYKETIYKAILQILSDNKDIDGLYQLSKSYNPNEGVYLKICNILVENKNIGGLYELASKNLPIREIKGNNLYLIKRGNMLDYIYDKIFDILAENKDIDGLHKLKSSLYITDDLSKKIDYKIRK